MPIPESFFDELRQRNSIEDVVERYVKLKRGGSHLVGLCPFHSEKNPSFTVFSDTQSFFCFGCGAGGDVITFLQRIENLDRLDAVKLLAEQSGMAIPGSDETGGLLHRQRDTVYKMNKEAARYFHSTLLSNAGKSAMEYLNARRLTASTIKRFGLGFAPDGWDGLTKHLLSLGYKKEDMEAGGLIIVNDKGRFYDRFRNRVIFPIIDTRGNVIGFGGRVLDNALPKYLNSPDTIVFKKSLNLYALNYAKNKNDGRLILAEGYMDVISLHQAGFTNAVATLGTAITQEQARLMSRYAKEAVIAYDSDEAGQKAAKKAITLLTAAGLAVKVIALTGGKDPDEYIKTYGADKFRLVLDGSGNHIVYQIEKAKQGLDLSLPDNKVEFLKRASDILCSISSTVEREVYIDKIAKDAEISKDALAAEVNSRFRKKIRSQNKDNVKEQTARAMGQRDMVNPQKRQHIKAARSEEGLIAILLRHPDQWQALLQKIKPSEFITDFNRRVYDLLTTRLSEGLSIELAAISGLFTVEEMGRMTYYLNAVVTEGDTGRLIDEYINHIKKETSKVNHDKVKEMEQEVFEEYVRSIASLKK